MAVSNVSYSAYHDASAATTNPTTASVLADTGAITDPGQYEVRVFVGCSVAAIFSVQHRDAANTGIVSDSVLIRAAAGQTGEYILKYHVTVTGQRFRILPAANITGEAECTVQAIRVV